MQPKQAERIVVAGKDSDTVPPGHDPDPPRALVVYVPLTTQNRLSSYKIPLPRLPFLDRESVANVQGLGSIPIVRLERRLGNLLKDVLAKLRAALVFALDLEASHE